MITELPYVGRQEAKGNRQKDSRRLRSTEFFQKSNRSSIAGASMETISAAVGAMLNTIYAAGASVGLVAQLVNGVKSILGC